MKIQIDWKHFFSKESITVFLKMTVGCIALIIGNYFFKIPNKLAFGGVTGLAIVLAPITPWSVGTINLVVSLGLLLIGFLIIGKSFGLKTAYVSILSSVGVSILEVLYPMTQPLTNQAFMEFVFAIILTAVGSGVLFQCEASSGGTDIIAMIFKKITGANIGSMLLLSDVLVVIGAFFVFDIEVALFSVLGLLIKSIVIDNTIDSINRRKYVTIVCDQPDTICDYIIKELDRGATVAEAKGAFSQKDKYIIFCVMSGRQEISLRRFIKDHAPTAFIMVSKTSEIFGKGFLEI